MDDATIDAARVEYAGLMPKYEAFGDSLRVLVDQLCTRSAFDIESVTARAKTVDSLVTKLRTHTEYQSLDDVTDKCGVRVITRYRSIIDPIAELLKTEFVVVEEVRHGGGSADTFGYASRHLLLRLDDRRAELPEYANHSHLLAEVQVRTILQHAWALISHSLDYKSGVDIPKQVRRRLFRVAALLETGDEIFDTFVDEVDRIRSGYREVARENWHELAIDLDSGEAVWEQFPWTKLVDAATAAGWRAADEWRYELPLDDMDRSALSRLVTAARDAGIERWGQLAAIAENIDVLEPELRAHVHVEGESDEDDIDLTPYAIGPWVLTFLLHASTREATLSASRQAPPAPPRS